MTASKSSCCWKLEQVLRDVGEHARRSRPRAATAAPTPIQTWPQPLAPARLHQERDEDADDERGLEPLAEADEVVAEQAPLTAPPHGAEQLGEPTLT